MEENSSLERKVGRNIYYIIRDYIRQEMFLKKHNIIGGILIFNSYTLKCFTIYINETFKTNLVDLNKIAFEGIFFEIKLEEDIQKEIFHINFSINLEENL